MRPPFGFLTNHGLALLCIAHDPEIRMRDIAADVQITERAAQRIVAELIDAGYLDRERVGRRNRYTIQANLPISLPAQRDVDLNSLLNVLLPVELKRGTPRRDARSDGSTLTGRDSSAGGAGVPVVSSAMSTTRTGS